MLGTPLRPGSERPPMSSRLARRPRGEGSILVTGACGRLGKNVVRLLHRTRTVVGVDRRPFPDRPKDVRHEQVDIRRKKLKDIFRSEPIVVLILRRTLRSLDSRSLGGCARSFSGWANNVSSVLSRTVSLLTRFSSSSCTAWNPELGSSSSSRNRKTESPITM